uniref:Uncharacterized protein n=1 Tax=Setaria viridis TaxID=4556 RepID=A0A4U6TKC4_SETVI|nr:hypothetical protein SEVIR_8G230084v2 [Setaria viridis]
MPCCFHFPCSAKNFLGSSEHRPLNLVNNKRIASSKL